MKRLVVLIFLVMLYSCADKSSAPVSETTIAAKAAASPIEGDWILVSNEVNGRLVEPKRYPQQVKMFHDGYFSFFMYDSAGRFYASGAGPYELDGNMYKETFDFYSDTIYIGSRDWQQWELKGDTLYFYGFKKGEMADGKDVTEEWGKDKFIEKRVRLKK